ncbi:ATP12 family chaperone protein [Meridianimarinicoccus sp. RP-17]|uniref:ATP12 family chaperone protein n=1 Tax=Meridianimarinicoccus zhengii TaxID=2056810 RepID=UPI000DAE2D32|nr:ATP12 family protein [Phycocomes zhengii]
MSEWKQRRFWDSANPVAASAGFGIALDGRPVRTPAKQPLVVPSRPLARAIADEWDAQAEVIDPNTMPLTRIANSAIDTAGPQHTEIAGIIAAYGESDLLCYRAEGPPELVSRQAAAWDPLLDWARDALDAPLAVGTGVIFVPQPEKSLRTLSAKVHGLDAFDLAPCHDLVALSGSLVIGLAVLAGLHPVETLWALSRVDETWQAEQWGHDEDAAEIAALRAAAFADAARFHALRHTA